MAGAPLTPQDVASVQSGLTAINKLLKDQLSVLKVISTFGKDNAARLGNDLKLKREILKEFKNEREAIAELHSVDRERAKTERQRLNLLVEGTKELYKQEAEIKKYSAAFDIVLTKRKQDVELLRTQGKLFQANAREIANSFKAQGPGWQNKANAGASAAVRASGAANDPASMLSALGPWGELVKIIVEVMDGIRKTTAEIQTASAESGNFANSLYTAKQDALNLAAGMTQLQSFTTKYGMSLEDVTKLYTTLKSTGIASLGVIPKTAAALSDVALNVMSFAKNTNQSTEQVADQYAQMSRSFNISTDKLTDHYKKVFDVASSAAEMGIAKVSEMMQATFSLADSFKEVGINLDGVTKLVDGVAHAIKALGRPGGIDQIQKIASGILGITKASEGWQVFMAKMSGVGGGFAQTLFSAQQRKADFTLPGANDFDPAKTIDMFKNTLSRTTGGIADPATRQFMVETMGKQVGMDTSTTQVFQKLMSGNLSKSQATSDLKKLHQAAIENNMSSKGMFDILRNILVGMIAKPIVYIWKLLAKTDADRKKAGAMASNLEKAEGNTRAAIGGDRDEFGVLKKSAVGSDVTRSGMMMVHAGNRIAPVAQRKPYGSTPGGGQNGVQINMNFNIDEKSLHKQFQAAEKQTLHYIRKQQKANF